MFPAILSTAVCLFWHLVCNAIFTNRPLAHVIWPLPLYAAAAVLDRIHTPHVFDMSLVEPDFDDGLGVYYQIIIGMWLAITIDHVVNFGNDKDRFMMTVHHACTLLVLLFSDAYGYRRIGAVVLMLHDIVDVPLQLLKIAVKSKQREWVCSLTYIVALIFWIASRNVLFTMLIVQIVLPAAAANPTVPRCVMTAALLILWICSAIWACILIRAPFKRKIRDADVEYEQIRS